MTEDRAAAEAPPAEEAEAIGEGSEVIGRALARFRDYLRRVRSGETRADCPITWYVVGLTALSGLVASVPMLVHGWYFFIMHGTLDVRWPVGWEILRQGADGLWHGAILGLALAVFDRMAGAWRRPLRWAVAGVVFTGLLAHLLPAPGRWPMLLRDLRTAGVWGVLWVPNSWLGGLFRLGALIQAGFWLWWVARAVPGEGRPYRRLAWAGFEGALVAFFVGLPFGLPLTLTSWLHVPADLRLPLSTLWAMTAAGLVAGAIGGALNGLAIAIALGRSGARGSLFTPRHEPSEGVRHAPADDCGS
jgi:hypothetical protein